MIQFFLHHPAVTYVCALIVFVFIMWLLYKLLQALKRDGQQRRAFWTVVREEDEYRHNNPHYSPWWD